MRTYLSDGPFGHSRHLSVIGFNFEPTVAYIAQIRLWSALIEIERFSAAGER